MWSDGARYNGICIGGPAGMGVMAFHESAVLGETAGLGETVE